MDYISLLDSTLTGSMSRRFIASNLGRVFDPPMGHSYDNFAKLIFQKTWETEIGWDDNVGAIPTKLFNYWLGSLKQLDGLVVPRQVTFFEKNVTGDNAKVQLHVLCDASEVAYDFAIFARTHIQGRVRSALLTAKSRLAPRRIETLPRLELCVMKIASKAVKMTLEVVQKINLST